MRRYNKNMNNDIFSFCYYSFLHSIIISASRTSFFFAMNIEQNNYTGNHDNLN
uniref:Uncharacterized protein n=1 Tax=Arundo donax TaxID=35708 RepID=A0A0A8ZFL1_ARUDO